MAISGENTSLEACFKENGKISLCTLLFLFCKIICFLYWFIYSIIVAENVLLSIVTRAIELSSDSPEAA